MLELEKNRGDTNTIAKLNNEQMAYKIMLNSLYGACANKWFRYFDLRIAEAITMNGQMVIKWTEKYVNQYLQKILETDKDYVIAMDTDSCGPDTIISINGKKITIEDFYNNCPNEFLKNDNKNEDDTVNICLLGNFPVLSRIPKLSFRFEGTE